MFRTEKHAEVIAAGFSGKEIASQLGERWKKTEAPDKKKYALKAEFHKVMSGDPDVLERTSTVHRSRNPEASVLLRRKSV